MSPGEFDDMDSSECEMFKQTSKELFASLKNEIDNRSERIKRLLELTSRQNIEIAELEKTNAQLKQQLLNSLGEGSFW